MTGVVTDTRMAAGALVLYANALRRRARSRSYVGSDNADHRARLRQKSDEADALAEGMYTGRYVVVPAAAVQGKVTT